jgi:hypothetical protein
LRVRVPSRIQTIREEADKNQTKQQTIPRMASLSCILAQFCDVDATPLILDVMALPQEWGEAIRVEALEAMIRNEI